MSEINTVSGKLRGRKFLVIVDDTPECMNALRFAARRAESTGGGVLMVFVIMPEAAQFWAGINERIREEAFEAAEERMMMLSREVRDITGILPEFDIREGAPVECVRQLLEENNDIRVLVLGAGNAREGPGPLVSAMTGPLAATLPVPVTIVPGGLTSEEIDAIC